MTITAFRFDPEGNLCDLDEAALDEAALDDSHAEPTNEPIDLRTNRPDDPVDHLVQLASGEIATVRGANAYQPEGPMTTFFATGSSRGTIDSWSVRVASYRTGDIVSIQRVDALAHDVAADHRSLVAV